jgi:DNA-binding transcriptional MerR regulator
LSQGLDKKPGFPEPERLMSTGDLARQTGSTLRTVRFYEEAGLLEPAGRKEGGHRLYRPVELERLRLILDLREAGLSLGDIKTLFELKHRCPRAEQATDQMSAILNRQIDTLQQKIATLRRLREELASTVSIISECRTCASVTFPRGCEGCEVLQREDLPRAVKLFWG